MLCEDSPDRVRELQELGVHFDADRHGALALGLEGGHSRRRVVHAGGSATGRRITRELSALAATHERIEVLELTTASAAHLSIDAAATGRHCVSAFSQKIRRTMCEFCVRRYSL